MLGAWKGKQRAGKMGGRRPIPEQLASLRVPSGRFCSGAPKREVLPELPERVDSWCTVRASTTERRRYDELLGILPDRVPQTVERDGVAAQCTSRVRGPSAAPPAPVIPGLIDERRRGAQVPSSTRCSSRGKSFGPRGHKASSSLNSRAYCRSCRSARDARGLGYEYLDGRTRDRARCVSRFQSDAALGLFLISFEGWGVGLNPDGCRLRFILDPWWNPAVEAQQSTVRTGSGQPSA